MNTANPAAPPPGGGGPSRADMPDVPGALTIRGALVRRSLSSAVGDVSVVGGRIASTPDRSGLEIDARGLTLLPLAREFGRPGSADLVAVGSRADLVVHGGAHGSPPGRTVILSPSDVALVLLGGHRITRNGALRAPMATPEAERWWGDWSDRRSGMVQHLGPDGRYSETRAGRPNAYTGRYWADGPAIAYLDDSGFWAFGLRHGDVIRHADFELRRR